MEYRKICNVCGQVFCYDDKDISNNKTNAALGVLSSVAAIANAVDGSMYHSYEQNKMGDRAVSKIKDFNRCPHCGSRDLRVLTDKEWQDYQDGLLGNNVSKSGISVNTNASTDSLIKRGMLYLEDADWKTALAYFENALDADPTNPDAYIGKMMIDFRIKTIEELNQFDKPIETNINYTKALRFAEGEKKDYIENLNSRIKENIIYTANKTKYDQAIELLKKGTIDEINDAYRIFAGLGDFIDSKGYLNKCNDAKYIIASKKIEADNSKSILEGIEILEKELNGYAKTPLLLTDAKDRYDRITKIEKSNEAEAEKKKKRKRTLLLAASLVITVLSAIYFLLLGPMMSYNSAIKSLNAGDYRQAYKQFKKASNYKDANLYLHDLIVVPSSISYKVNKGVARGEYGTFAFVYSDEGYLIEYTDTSIGGISGANLENSYILSSDSSGRITSKKLNKYNETTFTYENSTVSLENDLSYQHLFWTFDEKGNLIKYTCDSKNTNYVNDYRISKKSKGGLTETRTRHQGEHTETQNFAFTYDDLDLISKIVYSEQSTLSPDEIEYSIEYDVKYIPNAKVSSDTLFTNVWILSIASETI